MDLKHGPQQSMLGSKVCLAASLPGTNHVVVLPRESLEGIFT